MVEERLGDKTKGRRRLKDRELRDIARIWSKDNSNMRRNYILYDARRYMIHVDDRYTLLYICLKP